MKHVRWLVLALGVAGLGMSSGCKTTVPLLVSVGGPVLKNVKVIGRVEGVSTATTYLGGLVGPIGDDSLEAAVADALSKKGGDSLTNLTVDREVQSFGSFFLTTRTRVSGIAIKYKS